MTLSEKFELVRIADANHLELSIGSNGFISIGKWNKNKGKFEWHLSHNPFNPVDLLFEELNKHLNK